MRRIPLLTFPLLLALLLLAPSAGADDSLRCGQRLVTTGASMYKVRATCGEPQDKQLRTEWRPIRRLVRMPCGPGSRTLCTRMVSEVVQVQVQEWIYDFGRQRFLRHAVFEQGKLIDVFTGDYGGAR